MSQGNLVFRSDRCVVQLSCDDIIYISSMDHNICITTADRVFRTRSFTMSGLYELLSGSGFIRAHRSFIVNISYIEDVSVKGIRLKGINDILPLSRGYGRKMGKKLRESLGK